MGYTVNSQEAALDQMDLWGMITQMCHTEMNSDACE